MPKNFILMCWQEYEWLKQTFLDLIRPVAVTAKNVALEDDFSLMSTGIQGWFLYFHKLCFDVSIPIDLIMNHFCDTTGWTMCSEVVWWEERFWRFMEHRDPVKHKWVWGLSQNFVIFDPTLRVLCILTWKMIFELHGLRRFVRRVPRLGNVTGSLIGSHNLKLLLSYVDGRSILTHNIFHQYLMRFTNILLIFFIEHEEYSCYSFFHIYWINWRYSNHETRNKDGQVISLQYQTGCTWLPSYGSLPSSGWRNFK